MKNIGIFRASSNDLDSIYYYEEAAGQNGSMLMVATSGTAVNID